MVEVVSKLVLRKGIEHYEFAYREGEDKVIEAMAEMAADPESPFDWTDFALLLYQISRSNHVS